MVTREKPVDRGTRRARTACAVFGEELRRAGVEHGLSQRHVGTAVGLSAMHVSRIERGLVIKLSLLHACRLAAVVGLDLSFRAFPGGSPVHDAAHRALLDRARAAVRSPGAIWHYEVPLPLPDDQRAWDSVLELAASVGRLPLEAETRLSDVQALQRRVKLKLRDDPTVDRVVLLIADTKHNRMVLREHADALWADFPLDRKAILAALGAGQMPAASGWMLV